MSECRIDLSPEVMERFRFMVTDKRFEQAPVSQCFEAILTAGMNAIQAGAPVVLPKRGPA